MNKNHHNEVGNDEEGTGTDREDTGEENAGSLEGCCIGFCRE